MAVGGYAYSKAHTRALETAWPSIVAKRWILPNDEIMRYVCAAGLPLMEVFHVTVSGLKMIHS